jgi:hypothetical protein
MKRILSLTIAVLSLVGCAYGTQSQEDQAPVYGHTKGPGSDYDPDASTSNWGGGGDGVPYGCMTEVIKVENQLPLVLIICPQNYEPAFRWLVDPPPMDPLAPPIRQNNGK